MSRQDLSAEINYFLQQTDEGRALLAKFKHGAVDKKVISRLVQQTEGATMEKIKIVDALRASWTTYDNIQAYYADIFSSAVDHGMATYNPTHDHEIDKGDTPFDPTHRSARVIDWNATALAHIMATDELGSTMKVKGPSIRGSDLYRVVPAEAVATVNDFQEVVARSIRVQRRYKDVSMDSTHFTLVMPLLFDGQRCPFMVIYKSNSDAANPTWCPTPGSDLEDYFTFRVNKNDVKCMWVTSPSGGMTSELWDKFHEEIVYPCLCGNGDGDAPPSMHVFDGAHDHNNARTRARMRVMQVRGQQNPPSTTAKTQLADASQEFADFQVHHLPDAKRECFRELTKLGIHRGLSFADLPHILRMAFRKAFRPCGIVKGVEMIGMNPPARHVLIHPEIWDTRGAADATGTRSLIDLERLTHRLDQSVLLADSPLADSGLTDEEKHRYAVRLAHQLAGSKYGSAKFWRHCFNSPEMIFLQELYEWSVGYKKKVAGEKSALTKASRAVSRAKKEASYLELAPAAADAYMRQLKAPEAPEAPAINWKKLTVEDCRAILFVVYGRTCTEVNRSTVGGKDGITAWVEEERTKRQPGKLEQYHGGLHADAIVASKNRAKTTAANLPLPVPAPPSGDPPPAQRRWSDGQEKRYVDTLALLEAAPVVGSDNMLAVEGIRFPRQAAMFSLVQWLLHHVPGCAVAGGFVRDVVVRGDCANDIDCVVTARNTRNATSTFSSLAKSLSLDVAPVRTKGKAACVRVLGLRHRGTWWGPIPIEVDFVTEHLVADGGVDATASNVKIFIKGGKPTLALKYEAPSVTLEMCIAHIKATQFVFLLGPTADGAQRRLERYLSDPDGWCCLNSIPDSMTSELTPAQRKQITPGVGGAAHNWL